MILLDCFLVQDYLAMTDSQRIGLTNYLSTLSESGKVFYGRNHTYFEPHEQLYYFVGISMSGDIDVCYCEEPFNHVIKSAEELRSYAAIGMLL